MWALREINFEVKKGEVLGIIGKNGAGKSTLLKILSKVTAPTAGVIKTKGRIASLLEVGTGFHPELTGRQNIFLNGTILGMTKKEIEKTFDAIVDFSGVELYIDTPVKRYSSGMYVRLAFAVAAYLEPEILIVDEVLAVGDAEFQKKCLGRMKDVSEREGRTVLFVSHNMPAVTNLCTRVMVLQCGKIYFKGNTERGINAYLNSNEVIFHDALLQRNDRKGSGAVVCKNITFLNSKYEPVDAVVSGDELNIQIDYKAEREKVKYVLFRIQVLNNNHEIVFICNNEHSSELFPAIDSHGKAICTIPKLPLFGGVYYLNIQIYSRESGLLDEVEFAKELNVTDGDFFSSGKIPVIKKGVLVSHTWRMVNE